MQPAFALTIQSTDALNFANAATVKLRGPQRFEQIVGAYGTLQDSCVRATAHLLPLFEGFSHGI